MSTVPLIDAPYPIADEDRLARVPPRPQSRISRPGWRAAAIAIGGIVLAWGFAPYILTALGAAEHHRAFLGVAGYYPMDGLQYLAWVRDAHDGLIRNLYGSIGHAVFVQPMFSLTGIVQGALGAGPAPIMAFWDGIAVLVLLGGCLSLVTHYVPPHRVGRRASALLLALFGGFTPVVALLAWLDRWTAGTDFPRAVGDLVPAMSLWGYAPLAIALGLMPLVIERVERLLSGRGDRRTILCAAAMGLLVAWLHPWQGITLLGVAAGLVLWRALDTRDAGGAAGLRVRVAAVRRAARSLVPVTVATALPVVYYLVLSHIDGGWATSEQNSVDAAAIPGLITLTCVAPLSLVGLIAARRTLRDPRTRAMLLWLLSTLFTIGISPSGQYRALDGLAIPVAILVVRAWPERPNPRRSRPAAAVALAGALAPLVFFSIGAFGHLRGSEVTAYTELNPSDVRAATIAAGRADGAPVLAPAELGTAIPALTDAVSWVGHPIWTPNYVKRRNQARLLFGGALSPAQARQFVLSTGASVLLEPCGMQANLESDLASLDFRATQVGCAVVYTRARGRSMARAKGVQTVGARSTRRG